MSATTNHTTSEQLALGNEVVTVARRALAVCMSIAIAWSFSAWWSIALAFIVSLVLSMAALVGAEFVLDMFVDTSAALTALGGAAYVVSDTVRGWFTRAPKAIA